MKSLGQLFVGIITAAGSSILVLAALALALAEGGTGFAIPATPSSTATAILVLTPAGGVTIQPSNTSAVSTSTEIVSECKKPEGWVDYMIQAGDDLNTIAGQVNTSADELIKSNCLASSALIPGYTLYLPHALPTSTPEPVQPTSTPCGKPNGWVVYYVQSGDTLFALSLELHVLIEQLQVANCLTGTNIRTGMPLYVPFIPVRRSPVPSNTPIPPTETTAEGQQPTATLPSKPMPSSTITPTFTEAPTFTPTTPVAVTPENTDVSATVTLPPTQTNTPVK